MFNLSKTELKNILIVYSLVCFAGYFYALGAVPEYVDYLLSKPWLFIWDLVSKFAQWCIIYLIFRAIYKFIKNIAVEAIRKLKG